MDSNDLRRYIIDNGYPLDLVDFEHEHPNEAYCIRETKSEDWEVYYSEKGQKSGLVHFRSETEACKYLKDRIVSDYRTM